MKKKEELKLNTEAEMELLNSLESGEWKSVKDIGEETNIAKKAAKNYMRKDFRLNIRMSKADVLILKQKAAYKGLPYQTFISSILHEYAAGHSNATSSTS